MKKTLSVLILILTFALAAFTGCADNQTFTQKHYEYNDGETVSFNINATDREIEIGVSYDNKIYIECYESEKQYNKRKRHFFRQLCYRQKMDGLCKRKAIG